MQYIQIKIKYKTDAIYLQQHYNSDIILMQKHIIIMLLVCGFYLIFFPIVYLNFFSFYYYILLLFCALFAIEKKKKNYVKWKHIKINNYSVHLYENIYLIFLFVYINKMKIFNQFLI